MPIPTNNVRLRIKFANEGGEEEEDGSMKLSLVEEDDGTSPSPFD